MHTYTYHTFLARLCTGSKDIFHLEAFGKTFKLFHRSYIYIHNIDFIIYFIYYIQLRNLWPYIRNGLFLCLDEAKRETLKK